MKISPASLLLAFAGFLQESKCMYSSSSSGELGKATGTIKVILTDFNEFSSGLVLGPGVPEWLMSAPKRNFPCYKVFVYTFYHRNNHETSFFYDTTASPAHHANVAFVTIEKSKFNSQEFQPYYPGPSGSILFDHVYIATQGTKEIKYAKLYSGVQTNRIAEGSGNVVWRQPYTFPNNK